MKIWHYVLGYVIIEVVGAEIGRFVNLCAKRGVSLHNAVTEQREELVLKAGLSAVYLDEVKNAAEKCNCRIAVVERGGLLAFAKTLKKRIFLFVGMALCALVLYAANQFVWWVEIESESIVDENAIHAVLRDCGIYESAMQSRLDITKAELAVLKCDDRISWVDIREKGMKVVVRLSKSTENPTVHDVSRPCHVVANKRGVIEKIVATVGRKKVKVGDAFDEGDVLVSGVLPLREMTPDEEAYAKRKSEDGECLLVHSEAEIQARTWYDFIYGLTEFGDITVEQDGGRRLIELAYQRAKEDLSDVAAKDCVIKAHSVKIIDDRVKISFECSESIGKEKYVSKETIVKQKEFELAREQEAEQAAEKEKNEQEKKKKEKEEKEKEKQAGDKEKND